ncbi:zebrafish testis-expressed 38 isoform X2 [Festucalex cinctus]
MATATGIRESKIATDEWTELFPNDLKNKQGSLIFVKRMMAAAVSCITYLRGIFPEEAYRSKYLGDLCIKLLRNDCNTIGATKVVKWLMGCFDALEKQYLQIVFISHLGILPDNIHLSMKLYYYDDITPAHYEPPGFKEGTCDSLCFEGTAVHFTVGDIRTTFHTFQVRMSADRSRLEQLQDESHMNGNNQMPTSGKESNEDPCNMPPAADEQPSGEKSAQLKQPPQPVVKRKTAPRNQTRKKKRRL